MKKQFGFAIIILAILLTSGYLYLSKIPSTPTNAATMPPSPMVEKEITEDWKTYTSQKYNYEFKYPSEAKLSDQSGEYISVSFMGDKQKASGRTQTELFDGYAFNIADVTAGDYTDLDDFYAKKVLQLKDICTEIGKPTETTIDGVRAITHGLRCLNDYNSFYVLQNNRFFEISLLQVGEEEDLPKYKETVDKIFSTFRFIDLGSSQVIN